MNLLGDVPPLATMPAHGWSCFHCGAHFLPTDAGYRAARIHFGSSLACDPACTIDVQQFREMEAEVERYRAEDTDLHRALSAAAADKSESVRRAEEQGYAKGLGDVLTLQLVGWMRDYRNTLSVLLSLADETGMKGYHTERNEARAKIAAVDDWLHNHGDTA